MDIDTYKCYLVSLCLNINNTKRKRNVTYDDILMCLYIRLVSTEQYYIGGLQSMNSEIIILDDFLPSLSLCTCEYFCVCLHYN